MVSLSNVLWSSGIVFACIIQTLLAQGYCNFPDFLWKPRNNESVRRWLGRTTYIRNTPTWTSQQKILATQTEIIITEMRIASCDSTDLVMRSNSDDPSICYSNAVTLRLICVAHEAGNKYRIQQQANGTYLFTCMKFKQRGSNVVQLYSSELNEANEDRLCRDESLMRVDWPWRVVEQESWSQCPLVGGFDFTSYSPFKGHHLCHRVWLPSRIESECIAGDGMEFLFPKEKCSPFHNKTLSLRTDCVASWTEEDYTFVMFGESNQPARFVLRVPSDHVTITSFRAVLYFSPTISLDNEQDTSSGVWNMHLNLTKSQPGICYDESSSCKSIAQKGRCTNSAYHKYANFCPKSCGMCTADDTPKSECYFPEPYHGVWLLFHGSRKERITINRETIDTTHLGSFLCKSKLWSVDTMKTYKLLSTYNNGCRPRYTVMELSQPSRKLLQFKLSKSSPSDISFHMFDFGEKSTLDGALNINMLNVLIPDKDLIWGQCGIDGALSVNATWYQDGQSCGGVASDWDPTDCSRRTTLTLSLHACPNYNEWNRSPNLEFLCIGYYNIGRDVSLLITQETYTNEYRCWLIRRYQGHDAHKPWKIGIQFNSAQCPPSRNIESLLMGSYFMTLHSYRNHVTNVCEENSKVNSHTKHTSNTPRNHQSVTSHAGNSPHTSLKSSIWHYIENTTKPSGSAYPHQVAGARLAGSTAQALGACLSNLPLIFTLCLTHVLLSQFCCACR